MSPPVGEQPGVLDALVLLRGSEASLDGPADGSNSGLAALVPAQQGEHLGRSTNSLEAADRCNVAVGEEEAERFMAVECDYFGSSCS